MILRMIHRQIVFAGLACALSLGGSLSMQAQDNSTTTKEQTTTTTTQSHDSSDWQAPRGYDLAYPENGTPNMVARQGYAAGFNQGRQMLPGARSSNRRNPMHTNTRRYQRAWTRINSSSSSASRSSRDIRTDSRRNSCDQAGYG
jgi:hypothetical protein